VIAIETKRNTLNLSRVVAIYDFMYCSVNSQLYVDSDLRLESYCATY